MYALRRKAAIALSLAALASVTTLGATSASAAPTVNKYAGLEVGATSCGDDAVTIERKPFGAGADIWLRYSPSCRTIWAHVSGAAAPRAGDSAGGTALIYREQDGAADRCNAGQDGSCSTAMLNDAGYTSHASGTNDTGYTIYRGTTRSY
jgi:hypothetical protein